MKKNSVTCYVVVYIAITLVFASCERSKPIARVGNHVILSRELKEQLDDSRTPVNTMPAILNVVNRIVDDKLKLMDAYNSGLEQDSVVLAKVRDFEEKEVFSYLVERDVVRKIVPEKMIKARYKRKSIEWHVCHIFLPNTTDSLEALESLNSLRARVLRGEDFGLLAREYSKDTKSAGKNGDLGFVKWDNKMWGESFLNIVSKLHVGQISKIFVSDKGFHFAKLENTRQIAQQSYEKEKTNVERQLFREKSALLDSTYFSFREKMQSKYGAVILEDNIDSLLILIESIEKKNSKEKINMRRDPRQFFSYLSLPDRQFPLAQFKGGTYTFENVLSMYETISPMRRPALKNHAAILEFLNRNVPRAVTIHHGYKTKVNRHVDVKTAVLKEKESAMIRRIQRFKIDQNSIIPEQELLDQYNNNLHLYEDNIKVTVQEIQISDSTRAREIYQKALAGDDFSSLARNFNERKETGENAGMLGVITFRDYGNIGKSAVKLKTGKISEPIKSENRYSIIKILDRQAGEQKSFEDVRFAIRREKRLARRNQLSTEWMDSLKKNYHVTIYRELIKKEFELSDE